MKILLGILLFLMLIPANLFGQKKSSRTDIMQYDSLTGTRKSLFLDKNKVAVKIFDYGGIAPGYGLFRGTDNFVWDDNSYLFLFCPIVAASVPSAFDSSVKIKIVSDGVNDYTSPPLIEVSPDGDTLWQWQPSTGSSDLSQPFIAHYPDEDLNNDGKPDSWPYKFFNPSTNLYEWPSILPANVPQPLIEAVWTMDDRANMEFPYFPYLNDYTRRGIGLEIEGRAFVWNHFAFENSVIFLYKIKNISDKNLDSLQFGMYGDADVGGGSPENSDDMGNFISSLNGNYPQNARGIFYFYDNDMTGQNGKRLGFIGGKLFSGNYISSSYNEWVWSTDKVRNDLSMWNRMIPGTIDTLAHTADVVILTGSDYFALNSGEEKTFGFVISAADSLPNLISNILNGKALIESNFNFDSLFSEINFLNINNHPVYSGTINISWDEGRGDSYADIYYSSNAGINWKIIATDVPNIGSCSFNTHNADDAAFGRFKINLKNGEGRIIASNISPYFSINNEGNGSPLVTMLNEDSLTSKLITDDVFNFEMFIGDPDNSSLQLDIYYSLSGTDEFTFYSHRQIVSDTMAVLIPIDLVNIPNGEHIKIKFVVNDGSLSSIYITPEFSKNNHHEVLNSQYINISSGSLHVPFEVRVINPAAFKADEYEISFNDYISASSKWKTFKVYNKTQDYYVLEDTRLFPFNESKVFDGLTFYNEDVFNDIDTSKSYWNNPHPLKFNAEAMNGLQNKSPNDYSVVFSNEYNDSSNSLYDFPGVPLCQVRTTNFKVYDITNPQQPERIKFGFPYDSAPFGTISSGDLLALTNNKYKKLTWLVRFSGANEPVPAFGDTLFIFTIKGLSKFDTVKISGLPVNVKEENYLPTNFTLYQNYPNPFNPTTKIKFSIPSGFWKSQNVLIKIYDVLGREVETIINKEYSSGIYEVIFDGSKYASGMYIYKLTAGNFSKSLKMILIK